jgi:predicted SAM-dependent methyltransferase
MLNSTHVFARINCKQRRAHAHAVCGIAPESGCLTALNLQSDCRCCTAQLIYTGHVYPYFREAAVDKVNYLNVGCGDKFHKAWTNIDMGSNSPHVQVHNLLNGFPYDGNQFDALYHSQVLEHFPKEKAADFLRECYRVLKPGGIVRVVVPDLENIASEYLRHLNENIRNPTEVSVANYDWIMLEMYDQTVRNHSRGQMGEFLKQPSLPNERYIVERVGHRSVIESSRRQAGAAGNGQPKLTVDKLKRVTPRRLFSYVSTRLKHKLGSEASRIGAFRLGGEVHMWMYDRFSLSKLLAEVGFVNAAKVDAYSSAIPNWPAYELDVKAGAVFDPTSLFMEARKPAAS